jgi:hypothetical protein
MAGTGGPTSTTHGGDIPATIWTDYMKKALGDADDPGFPKPGKIGDGKTINEKGAPSPTPSMTTPPPTTAPPTTAPPTQAPTQSPTWQPPTDTPSPTDTPRCSIFNPQDCNSSSPTSDPTATDTGPPGRNHNGGTNGTVN